MNEKPVSDSSSESKFVPTIADGEELTRRAPNVAQEIQRLGHNLRRLAGIIDDLATAISAPNPTESQPEAVGSGDHPATSDAKRFPSGAGVRRAVILVAFNAFGLQARFTAKELLGAIQQDSAVAAALHCVDSAVSLGRLLSTICDYAVVDGITMHQVPRMTKSHGVCRYYLAKAAERSISEISAVQ